MLGLHDNKTGEATLTTESDARNAPAMGRGLTLAMSAAMGLAVANNYYNQPLIGLIIRDLPGPATPYVPTVTQFGYAIGLFLLVPLGDMVERRRITVGMFLLLTVALAAAAMAPNGTALVLASLFVGLAATAAQQILPFAANLAAPERRGRVVSTVAAGAIMGVLLSRTVAGFVGAHYGWRAMFWGAVPVALAGALLMAMTLPRNRPDTEMSYRRLMASLAELWRTYPALRLASVTQFLMFACFMAFWTTMALHLQQPEIGLGPEAAGTFGLIGVVGMVIVPIMGRVVDRHGAFPVVVYGTLVSVATWILMGVWSTLAGLIVGVIILDGSARSAMTANQVEVFALDASARSRINTIFVGAMYLGGASGSALATIAMRHGGWSGVAALGAGLAAASALLQVAARRRLAPAS
jgi:predicted MFS family arabinose efflux permease